LRSCPEYSGQARQNSEQAKTLLNPASAAARRMQQNSAGDVGQDEEEFFQERKTGTRLFPLTPAVVRGGFGIMGDKSPKANQKQKAQQKAKASFAAQKKERPAAVAKAAPRKK